MPNILPKIGSGDSVFHFLHQAVEETIGIIANLASLPFDFSVRQKMGGTNVNFYIMNQFPVLPPRSYHQPCLWLQLYNLHRFLLPYILELTCTAYDLQPFARDCGYHGPPFRWDEERRFLLRCEVDAAYFHLYGIERPDVAYIMDTFPIVRRKDEDAYGEYRTKRVILEIYNEMAEAMKTGRPYQTRLDPPPADPRVAHAWDERYLGPYREPATWWWEDRVRGWLGEGVREDETVRGWQGEGVAAAQAMKEPGPAFQLRPPTPPPIKEEEKSAPATQQPLLAVAPAPTGPRARRLKRAMALGKDPSPAATRELVAFLADEDSSIRWLAGSSLVQRASRDVVAAMAAFLEGAEPERVEAARPEMQRVLGLIGETAEGDAVRASAQHLLARTRAGKGEENEPGKQS
jgi:hypothetical protein